MLYMCEGKVLMDRQTIDTQGTSSDSPGTEQVGKFRMERMGRVVKDLVKHTQ